MAKKHEEAFVKTFCPKCKGTGLVPAKGSVYYNCEGGGDCSKDSPGWTYEDCKKCLKVECPVCKGDEK